jgi:Sulfotransferase family
VDTLMKEASEHAGLIDFGKDEFKDGLERFLSALERETTLSETAARELLAQIRQRLISRLEVEEWYRLHPDIEHLPAGPTTSITGLPRTGTTALANVMSLDDGFRSLRGWEQGKPCPPPILNEEETDPRRVATVAYAEQLLRAKPELAAMHLFDPDATEEDVELLGMSCRAQQLVLPIFSYHAWWRTTDMRAAFAYHRRVTKLLQSRRGPNTWLFKAPSHNFHLDAYFLAYPDTRVVVTHRDPAKVVPSAVSLMAAFQPEGSEVDPVKFGRLHAEHLRVGVERAVDSRARIGEERFLDVHHRDFVADPMDTLQRIYDFLDRPLHPETRDKMQKWLAKNRTGSHGRHDYTAEQFGLSAQQLRSDFDFYIERYDVPIEK